MDIPYPKLPVPLPQKNERSRIFHFSLSDIVNLSVIEVVVLFAVVLAMTVAILFAIKNSGIMGQSSAANSCQDDLRNCQANVSDQASAIDQCNSGVKQQSETNSFDRVRMSDATNILLALQNYNFDKGDLPQNLKTLAAGDYYSGNLADPESGTNYYYKKIDSQNYVLCFYLSTGVCGTNKSQCPVK